MRARPEVTMINGNPGTWSSEICAEWEHRVAPRFRVGQTCSSANFYLSRPHRDEYNRASCYTGFTYVVEPGHHVATTRWIELETPQ